MHLFKGKAVMPDEDVDMEAQKASVIRLAQEMSDLSELLLLKARELQEEIKHGKDATVEQRTSA
jgi:hypothetical protein